jgi:hypothetical protein
MKKTAILSALMVASGAAMATGVGDVAGFADQPRLFNDFGGSTLNYASNWAAGSVSIQESNYGSGGWANRHAAWWGDAAGSAKTDFDFGDGFDASFTMQVNASDVGNVEAGFQADLFGFGLFGVLTASGEIAAFGSVLPFHSFGTGLYNNGDVLQLRMIHRPGVGDGLSVATVPSTMEYLYNNVTQGSGWVSSGQKAFTTTEGGIPSFFNMFFGLGAQINQPQANGSVEINFSDFTLAVPAPGAVALLGLGGLAAARRRRA